MYDRHNDEIYQQACNFGNNTGAANGLWYYKMGAYFIIFFWVGGNAEQLKADNSTDIGNWVNFLEVHLSLKF